MSPFFCNWIGAINGRRMLYIHYLQPILMLSSNFSAVAPVKLTELFSDHSMASWKGSRIWSHYKRWIQQSPSLIQLLFNLHCVNDRIIDSQRLRIKNIQKSVLLGNLQLF